MSDPKYFKELYSTTEPQSALHCKDTQSVRYFAEQLFDTAISHYVFDGVPDTWDMEYFYKHFFHNGVICVINPIRYGVIPQECTLYGYNVFREPTHALVANPLIESREYQIGKDTEIVWLNNMHKGIDEICEYYANLMALTMQTYAMNQINCRKSAVFNVNTKQQAETMKKMYDQITAGNTASFVTYGNGIDNPWQFFADNSVYIGTNLLDDLKTIKDNFLTEIGVNNANTQKKERMITDEVNANNSSIQERCSAWIDCINRGLSRVNNMFGLSLRCSVRQSETGREEDKEEGVSDNADNP